MTEKAMHVYLNDHLAGAMFGNDLAAQIATQNEGTPLGDLMQTVAGQIAEDRQALIELMDRLDVSKSTIKQATTWMAEKVSRPKFSGLTSGEPELGTFMALESLALGVQGKLCLWTVLKELADRHPLLGSIDLDVLIDRAKAQHLALERERLAAGARALTDAAS
jgi:hypothetical protein